MFVFIPYGHIFFFSFLAIAWNVLFLNSHDTVNVKIPWVLLFHAPKEPCWSMMSISKQLCDLKCTSTPCVVSKKVNLFQEIFHMPQVSIRIERQAWTHLLPSTLNGMTEKTLFTRLTFVEDWYHVTNCF